MTNPQNETICCSHGPAKGTSAGMKTEKHVQSAVSHLSTWTTAMPPSYTAQDTNRSIVLLTDNEQRSKPLAEALLREDFQVQVQTKKKNRDILDQIQARTTDLLLIDSERFSLEELSTFSRVRSVYSGPLMLLIEDVDEMVQVLLYEQGVDDLLVKPTNQLLLLAHIRALLRRHNQRPMPTVLSFNGLEINTGLRRATYNGQEIPFTSREFDLLCHLAQHACVTLDRDQLYRSVFGIEYNGYDRAIDMYIARIRAKMAPFGRLDRLIKTVRGTGYLFAGEF